MGTTLNIQGTSEQKFKIGKGGVLLKNSSENLSIRDTGDTAAASITASTLLNVGNNLTLNALAAGSGADWTFLLARPATGMTASWTLTFPPTPGSTGQVLSTDGAGVTSWVSAGSTADLTHVDVTALSFGDGATKSMFTLPANSTIEKVRMALVTPFNGTSPTVSIGVNGGSTSKYATTTQTDLKDTAGSIWEVFYGGVPNGSTEALEIYYVASGSSAGSANFYVYYSTPI